MQNKPPFGFRQTPADAEPEPPEAARQETSNTSCSTERNWSPNVQARVTTTDGSTWRLR
jgi:hypothetical protein